MPGTVGIHHVTAICGDAQRNADFYAGVLGLRLVKRTVNFDDAQTYHLYFGNNTGAPGSLITFFPWGEAPRGRVGPGQVAVTSFAVWNSCRVGDPWNTRRHHVGTRGAPTVAFLQRTFGHERVAEDGTTEQFEIASHASGSTVQIRTTGDFPRGHVSVGTVHHVAWRVPDGQAQLAMRQRLVAEGFDATPVIDRKYFTSVYFREPGGVLFEIATDGPGFATDESPEQLGEKLMLPENLEPDRAYLTAMLPPIHTRQPERGA